jgi:hypothetical protein
VSLPLAGARVTSPLIAEGVAINNWFFEGQFVAELVVDGEVMASWRPRCSRATRAGPIRVR